MESLLYRYRNITVLLVVIFAQLILLAWQVKSDNDVPLVRVWAITAVTPVASAVERTRGFTTGAFANYFQLRDARNESHQLRLELDRYKLENQFLRNELAAAQRATSMVGFQARTPSKMIGARIIGATTGVGTKSVLIDRGLANGVRKGMAVVTPDGIVGKVQAVYPLAAQVLAVTDPGFGAGVESQVNHVHGVVKGVGNGVARVDFIPLGQKVAVGEQFFTSGEDRVFPKGLPVGRVTSVKDGGNFQEILVAPSGMQSAPEEVLVVVDPIHQEIPDVAPTDGPVFLAPDVKPEKGLEKQNAPAESTADKLLDQYRKVGDAQNHKFGVGMPGSLPPNFNLKPDASNPAAAKPAAAKPAAAKPAADKPAAAKTGASKAAAPKPSTTTSPAVRKPSAGTTPDPQP